MLEIQKYPHKVLSNLYYDDSTLDTYKFLLLRAGNTLLNSIIVLQMSCSGNYKYLPVQSMA